MKIEGQHIIMFIAAVAALWFVCNVRFVLGTGSSMEPTITSGTLLACIKNKEYHEGDIVLYQIGGFRIGHRIAHIDVNVIDGGRIVKEYTLKGDNNDEVDTFKVYDENILCKLVVSPHG